MIGETLRPSTSSAQNRLSAVAMKQPFAVQSNVLPNEQQKATKVLHREGYAVFSCATFFLPSGLATAKGCYIL